MNTVKNRFITVLILLFALAVFVHSVKLDSQQRSDSEQDISVEESAIPYEVPSFIVEEISTPVEKNYLDDYKWYYKIYDEAIEIAEGQGIYQGLYLREKWTSAEGNYCAYFVAEYSDSGIYLEAQSKESYKLVYKPSIYTDNFSGMDYRTLEIEEEKIKKIEEILLSYGINERCTLYGLEENGALVNMSSDIWYCVDLTERKINKIEMDKENREERLNWDNHERWWEAYQEVIHDWLRLPEWEKEFADTLGGTVEYDPHLLQGIGDYLVYERYGVYDLDQNGIPELILMSDHSSSMNAIFTYTDRLIYCGTYYNALFTEDGRIIERGNWFRGSAMIQGNWYITELKNGEIVYIGEIWAEYQVITSESMKYMNYIEAYDETLEISYEEYCKMKNELLYTANFIRNIDSKEIAETD